MLKEIYQRSPIGVELPYQDAILNNIPISHNYLTFLYLPVWPEGGLTRTHQDDRVILNHYAIYHVVLCVYICECNCSVQLSLLDILYYRLERN